MQYKTIVLEMLQQRPDLHEQLQQQRKLLTTMEKYAKELKASHEAIKAQLQKACPENSTDQTSSEAFELALKELESRLPPESPMDNPEEITLDAAMGFIRSHSRCG